MTKSKRVQIFLRNTTEERLESVEKYIASALNAKRARPDVINLPSQVTKSKQDYRNQVSSAKFHSFAQSAQKHYFVSRILFLSGMSTYSFFPAQLCVENYLKAFINLHGKAIPQSHDLDKLLQVCRTLDSDSTSFVNSEFLEAIVLKYAPFVEYPRFPIFKSGPDFSFGLIYPNDILFLDYFTFRIKQIVVLPSDSLDVFRGQYSLLQDVPRYHPELIELFETENINFP